MKLAKIVAINVKNRLNAIDMTETQLASLTTIPRNTINKLANGKAKMVQYETIEQVSKALRCKPSQLFDEDTNWTIFKRADTYKNAQIREENK